MGTSLTSASTDPSRLRLSVDDAAELSREIGELARAGLPLPEGLRAAAGEVPRRRVRAAMIELAGELESGRPLDGAFEKMGTRFPRHLRGLILAGIRHGCLDTVLDHYSAHHQSSRATKRRIWMSIGYPLALMLIFILWGGGFTVYFFAQMGQVFDEFGADLPFYSEALVWFARSGWRHAIVALAGGAAALVAMRVIGGAPWYRFVANHIPLIGPVWRWKSLAECCRLLALFLDRRIPLPTAFDLAADGIDDAYLAHGCRTLAGELTAGRTLVEGLLKARQFPPTLHALVAWGERTSSLAEVFRSSAEWFEERLDNQLELIRAVASPLAFLAILAGISLMVTAAVLPVYNMISKFVF